MYPNLKAEMARKGITAIELVKALPDNVKMAASTFSQKFNGKFAFTLDEADAIRSILGVEMSIDELFTKVEE